ncbi:uncharacterized protein [Miscanthus floridulus]|uniref:uncharacterized protein n=1 Tax=Miscanthus floridulus TaxID=154761 RepID=UPI00345AC233
MDSHRHDVGSCETLSEAASTIYSSISCLRLKKQRQPFDWGRRSTCSLRSRAISRIAQTRKAPARASFARYRGDCGTRHRRLEKEKPAISPPIQSNRSPPPPPSLLARWNRRARSHPRLRTSDETKPSTSPSSSRDAAALASRTCDPDDVHPQLGSVMLCAAFREDICFRMVSKDSEEEMSIIVK